MILRAEFHKKLKKRVTIAANAITRAFKLFTKPVKSVLVDGGDEEVRTLDLTDANRTLSQLSYIPTKEYVTILRQLAKKSKGKFRVCGYFLFNNVDSFNS